MKNFKLSIIFALALIVTISSCKKKDEDPKPTTPTLKSFSFPTTTDLEIEMTWSVNGVAAGHNYVDLDFEIYSGTGASYNDIVGSYNSTGTEAETLSSSTTNFTGTLGINYYENETALSGLTSPYTIVYTFKVYPTGNVAAAQTYTASFVNPTTVPDQDILLNQMSVVKTATSYTFTELSPKTKFNWDTGTPALARVAAKK